MCFQSFIFAHLTTAAPHARPILQPDVVQDTPVQQTLQSLNDRLNLVEGRNPGGIMIFVLLLYATVCALWAQNTNRNPWLWFFLGLIFSIITAFVVLHKNAMDLQISRSAKPKARS